MFQPKVAILRVEFSFVSVWLEISGGNSAKKLCLETPAEQSTLMMKQHGKDENRTQRKTQFLRCHAIQTFSLDARQN